MHYKFFINPTSGINNTKEISSIIHAVCNKMHLENEIIVTYNKSCILHHLKNSTKNETAIFAGGDGTIHFAINNINNKTPIGIIPIGTGNDFFKHFKLNKYRHENYIYKLLNTTPSNIDIIDANGIKFINSCSIGFDASVANDANLLKSKTIIPKKLVYPIAAAKNLFSPKTLNLEILIDGETKLNTSSLIFAVMNGSYYGGGFNPTPNASIQDGLIDICLVTPPKKLDLPLLIPKFSNGTHETSKYVDMFKCKKLTITPDKPVLTELDGEIHTFSELNINILPNHQSFLVPN